MSTVGQNASAHFVHFMLAISFIFKYWRQPRILYMLLLFSSVYFLISFLFWLFCHYFVRSMPHECTSAINGSLFHFRCRWRKKTSSYNDLVTFVQLFLLLIRHGLANSSTRNGTKKYVFVLKHKVFLSRQLSLIVVIVVIVRRYASIGLNKIIFWVTWLASVPSDNNNAYLIFNIDG